VSPLERLKVLDPDSGLLLHEVIFPARHNEDSQELLREDFSDPGEFLQGAIIDIPSNHTFQAHVHLERERQFQNLRAQESWVVISGRVEVDYYSETGKFLTTLSLGPGDISISFRGGHGYRTLSSNARVYEFKSGPYEGQAIDKVFIS
jgi:hypothetical protein